MRDITEDYKKMQEKFNLPEINKIKSRFNFDTNITDIEEIRNEMASKIFDFTERVVEPLIWCNSHCHMIEKSMLTDPESKTLFSTYKTIQSLKWRNNLLTLKPNKKESVKLIKDLLTFWDTFEPKMSKICKKFSDGWSDLRFKKEHVEYSG